jgi:hypothetical protein
MSAKKQKQLRSVMKQFHKMYEENSYLIEMALEQGEFETEEDLDQWYSDACFIKMMDLEINDQQLMPEELDLLMLNLGLIKESKYFEFGIPER